MQWQINVSNAEKRNLIKAGREQSTVPTVEYTYVPIAVLVGNNVPSAASTHLNN